MSLYSLLFPQKPVTFLKYFELPAMAANAILDYSLEGTLLHCRKFAPFTNFQLVNNSTAEFEIRFDYSDTKKIKVLSGAVKAVKNQPFYSFQVYNLSGALTEAGKTTIELETIR